MLRLTASAGFPLSWIENPEWVKLCDNFIPGAPQISRKVLMQRILWEVVNEFREEAKRKCSGKEATMQSDGWTGINHHHLLAFMIMADQKVSANVNKISILSNYPNQVHTVKVTDTMAE